MEYVDINLVVLVLIIVSIVAIFVRGLKLPYTLALIFTGLGLTFFRLPVADSLLEKFPELLLTLILPALLFEGAMNINSDELKKNIKTVSLLAVLGVILSVFISGVLFHYLMGLPWEISFLFGALIAPTDPIAVLNIFKGLGVSRRLSTIVEAESLFNDGTGIVIFKVIVGLIAASAFDIRLGVIEFVRLAFGGVVLGFVLGNVASRLMRIIDDRMVQISLTTIVAYGGYILAENLNLSGVIAVVTAGIVVGSSAIRFIGPSSRLAISSFWEYSGFLLNSVVFLLIGMGLHIEELVSNLWLILLGFLIVIFARIVYVSLLSFILNRFDDSRIINNVNECIPYRWIPVIVWGGLHGGLSMVLALSLSPTIGVDKQLIMNLTFGIVFFSLVFQGSTMAMLLRFLGLTQEDKKARYYQRMIAKLVASTGADNELDRLYESRVIPIKMYKRLKKVGVKKRRQRERAIEDILHKSPELKKEINKEAERAIYLAKRSAITKGMKEGLFSEEVGEEFIRDIDRKLVERE